MDKLELAKEAVRIYFEKQCSVEIAISEVIKMKVDSLEEFSEVCEDVAHDKNGCMKYHPFFHRNNRMKWTKEDIEYLVKWYNIIDIEEMSLALERTVRSVQQKVVSLSEIGLSKRKYS